MEQLSDHPPRAHWLNPFQRYEGAPKAIENTLKSVMDAVFTRLCGLLEAPRIIMHAGQRHMITCVKDSLVDSAAQSSNHGKKGRNWVVKHYIYENNSEIGSYHTSNFIPTTPATYAACSTESFLSLPDTHCTGAWEIIRILFVKTASFTSSIECQDFYIVSCFPNNLLVLEISKNLKYDFTSFRKKKFLLRGV